LSILSVLHACESLIIFFLNQVATGVGVFVRNLRVMYGGVDAFLSRVRNKMEMPGSGRYRGNPADSTVSRRECENESEQGSHPDLPLCTTARTESNVSYSYAKKAPIYFSGRSRIGTIYRRR